MKLRKRVRRLERMVADLLRHAARQVATENRRRLIASRPSHDEPWTPERLADDLERREEALLARIGAAIGADGAGAACRVKALAAFIYDPRRAGWPLEVVVSRLCAIEPELADGLSLADIARAVGADRLDRSGTGPSSEEGCSAGACSASSPRPDDQ